MAMSAFVSTQGTPWSQADLAPAPDDVDGRAIVTIRLLAADAVEQARSGHPGLPMGMATAAWVLWSRWLRHDPADPGWPDRDRFVLSAGHGSMLLYALLHLFGYDLPRDELRRFRQWGSRTPGHPELGVTPGVETTTGPLGQGIGNAVGMALAERMLAARYNRGLHRVVDHFTWVIASDGDLMEGISHEAASLAGHLGLARLVVLYDDNRVTIDGGTTLAYSDDAEARFAAYGWQTRAVEDGNDRDAVDAAIRDAVADEQRPTLIRVRTHIGYGAPTVQDTSSAHGAPLGADELARTKARFGWPVGERFRVPDDVAGRCRALARRATAARRIWDGLLAQWEADEPALAAQWRRTQAGDLPAGLDDVPSPTWSGAGVATRTASRRILSTFAEAVPELVGGAADLAGSTGTLLAGDVRRGCFEGRTIHFGVREHAMGAALNGMALHGGLRPFGGTFLVFSDYMRPAIRLAALMGVPVVYVFTHDSIGVGEDGPTHQPVEHLAALRAIPGLAVLRPADAHETAEAWRTALRRTDGPTALILTRQPVPVLPPVTRDSIGCTGAWIVHDPGREPDVALVATGSEVALALEAASLLEADGVAVRVVSMPWQQRFLAQPAARAADILPRDVPRVVIEAGVPQGWDVVAGPGGRVVALERFGASAPGRDVLAKLGFTAERIMAAARDVLAGTTRATPTCEMPTGPPRAAAPPTGAADDRRSRPGGRNLDHA